MYFCISYVLLSNCVRCHIPNWWLCTINITSLVNNLQEITVHSCKQYMSCNMRFPTMLYVRPAKPQISLCAYAQSDQSLCLSLEYSMTVKLLTEHHLEFLSLKGGYTGSSESTLVKMPHFLKSRVAAQLSKLTIFKLISTLYTFFFSNFYT